MAKVVGPAHSTGTHVMIPMAKCNCVCLVFKSKSKGSSVPKIKLLVTLWLLPCGTAVLVMSPIFLFQEVEIFSNRSELQLVS